MPQPKDNRLTQKDVARAAGVNRSTVSLALNGSPSVAKATRTRIQQLAEKMGYLPDPMLSALAVYRHGRAPAAFHGKIAWVAHSTGLFRWRATPHFTAYYEGARKRAAFHGYGLEVIDLAETGSVRRAAAIIRSRGIRGMLLCPQPAPDTNLGSFPWDEVSAVTFGYSTTNPALHSVAAAQFRASMQAVRELQARGYVRIGFAMNRNHDNRTDHNYLGGYVTYQTVSNRGLDIPPFLGERDAAAGLLAWYRTHRPDAIVIGSEPYATLLEQHGVVAPRDVGLICPALGRADGPVTGIWESNELIGEAGIDALVAMMHRGERGVPAQCKRLLVEGLWVKGRTLRPLPGEAGQQAASAAK